MESNVPRTRPGRPEAAAAVWSWRRAPAAGPAPTRDEGAGPARLRGLIQGAVGAGVGLLVHHTLSETFGTAILIVTSVIFLSAMLSPRVLYAGIERLFVVSGAALSRAVTWISLAIVLYTVFLPFGAIFRRGRRDRMKRYFEPEATTYWTLLDAERPAPDSYEKLY